jgi:hypothetical protein
MAVYSPLELHEVLIKLSQDVFDVKYLKFPRLGVFVKQEEKSSESDDKSEERRQYQCAECKKKLISSHLLDLHLLETHDSYFDVQKLKVPMVRTNNIEKSNYKLHLSFLQYSCYLEECKHKSLTAEERRGHCIDSHKFPHDFRFDKIAPRKKSPSNERMDTAEDSNPPPSSTKPKITSFHFGHKSQKVFTKSKPKKDAIESMIVDLKESLPE